jgi:opacity protein-like surface antigen
MRVALLAAVVAAILAPAALAASPQQVYADLADNGRLDVQYSDADLQAALRSAVVQAYGEGSVQEEIEGALGAEASGSGVLPFTGVDLALLVAFGITMVLIGTGLRRLRPRRNL